MKRRSFNQRILSIGVAVAFIPQTVLSMPLFEPTGFPAGQWRQASPYALRASGVGGIGIGGLRLDISSSSELTVNPENLHYIDGFLQATIEEKQYAVKVNPLYLIPAIDFVQNTKQRKFEVSIDPTRSGQVPYMDKELPEFWGVPMLMGDLDFAGLVAGRQPLPVGAPKHPHEETRSLLESDKDYRNLTQTWTQPPLSRPQIFLTFDLAAPGLVSMKFSSEVLFSSPYGHPLEVDKTVQFQGERPYGFLIRDVQNRPNAYRQELSALDTAASITAALGLIAAGCQQPKSCQHLFQDILIGAIQNSIDPAWLQSLKESDLNESQIQEQIEAKIREVLKLEAEKLAGEYQNWLKKRREPTEQNSSLTSLISKWDELRFRDFQPGNNSQAWARTYDSLQYLLQPKFLLGKGPKYGDATPTKALTIIKQQFSSFPNEIPNDPLLKAAHAFFIFVEEQDPTKVLAKARQARQNLELAESSTKFPGTKIEISNIGIWMGANMINAGRNFEKNGLIEEGKSLIQEGKSLLNSINQSLPEKQVKAYNEVDLYLASCIEKPSSQDCSSENLRTWEADIVKMENMFTEARFLVLLCIKDSICADKSNLQNDELGRSILSQDVLEESLDWLYGRLAYLVAVQEPKFRGDRLRLLSHYAQKLEGTKYGQELTMFKKRLISMGN